MRRLYAWVRFAPMLALTSTICSGNAAGQPLPSSSNMEVRPFCSENSLWGYARADGAVVIKPQFLLAGEFAENLAPVKVKEGEYIFIRLNGESDGPRFALADAFSEGLAAVKVDDRFGYVNPKMTLVIKPQYVWAGPFREGRAAVKIDDKYGFVDLHGELVIRPQFSRVTPFSNGFAAVEQDGRWGYLDLAGSVRLKPQYVDALPFSSRVAWVRTHQKFECINEQGELAFNKAFDRASPFFKGLAAVRLDGQSGLVNSKGETAVALKESPVWRLDRTKRTNGLYAMDHDLVVLARESDGKVVFETKLDPYLKSIKFQSIPNPANVFCPTLWDLDHAASKHDLMTSTYRLPEWETDCESVLAKGQRYHVIFELNGKIEEAELTPTKDNLVKVRFR